MRCKVSEKEIKYIQTQTLATLKIEGLKPSQQSININSLFLNSYIDNNTAIKQIIKFHLGRYSEWKPDIKNKK